jgi:hypothetical protein
MYVYKYTIITIKHDAPSIHWKQYAYVYIYTPIYGQGLPHTRGQTNMDVDNPWFPFREIIYNI